MLTERVEATTLSDSCADVDINIKAVILNTSLNRKRNHRCKFFTILGAFTKLRKATISFVMSVCLSVRMEQLGYHWTECHEI